MKPKTRNWLFTFSVLMLIVLLALLFSAWLLNEPLDGMSLVINGERVVLNGFDTPHAALLITGGAAAMILAFMVALLVLVLAAIAAALGIALAFLAATAGVLVAVAPLLLVGWLVWRALRQPVAPRVVPSSPLAAS